MDQKVTGTQKVILMKNQFFHARQSREEIFEFCSCSSFIFMAFGHIFCFVPLFLLLPMVVNPSQIVLA